MAILYYKKINETYIRIASDEQYVLKELSEYFSFFAEGYRFSPKFRHGIWNGKINLVNLKTMTTLAGLVPAIAKFCAERNYQLIDQTEQYNKFVPDDLNNFDQWVQSLVLPFEPRQHQIDAVRHGLQVGRSLILSPTGCHAKGTKIIMHDGSVKNVEDVKIGDCLLGPDGEKREVLRLYHDKAMMYRIKPIRSQSFVVNGDHVLALFNVMNKQIEYCTVDTYLTKSNNYKHTRYLVQNDTPIKFDDDQEKQLPLDPYFVGVYLGDGHCISSAITVGDECLAEYIEQYCQSFEGIKTRRQLYSKSTKAITIHITSKQGNCNVVLNRLREIGINVGLRLHEDNVKCETKSIPECYQQGSIKQRFELLAGLVDTDGYLANNSFFEYSTKSKRLAEDIRRLAGSLGYNTSLFVRNVNGTDYYKVNILGDVTKIPTRVPRKQCRRTYNRNKDPRHQTFEIEQVGEDEFFGFELSKDHLYFTDNWIINHNSGKSLDLYMIMRWMLERGRKVAIVVPSTSLVEQMHSDFKNYAAKDKTFDVDQRVHKLYAKIKTTDPYNDQCIITTWQSIKNYDKTLFETWDCVMIDEAHACKALELSKILQGSVNAKYRLGFTGTLTGMVCHEYQITGLLGSVCQVITTKELQNKGHLSDCTIYMVDMKYPADEAKKLWNETKLLKKTYLDEVDFVNHHVKRQLFIRNLACSLKGTTLILFRFREHGELLFNLIKEKVGDSRPVYHIDGTIDAQRREAIRQELKNPDSNAILVFSVATSSTGIDIKSIENLILSPSKSKVQTLQSIGRSLRLCEGKKGAKVFDLIDDLRTGKRRNFLYNLAQKRLEFYTSEGLDVQFKQVQF